MAVCAVHCPSRMSGQGRISREEFKSWDSSELSEQTAVCRDFLARRNNSLIIPARLAGCKFGLRLDRPEPRDCGGRLKVR